MTTYKEIQPADKISGQYTEDQIRPGDIIEYVVGGTFRTVEVISVDGPDGLTRFSTFTGYLLSGVGGHKLISFTDEDEYSKVWGYFDQIVGVYISQQTDN